MGSPAECIALRLAFTRSQAFDPRTAHVSHSLSALSALALRYRVCAEILKLMECCASAARLLDFEAVSGRVPIRRALAVHPRIRWCAGDARTCFDSNRMPDMHWMTVPHRLTDCEADSVQLRPLNTSSVLIPPSPPGLSAHRCLSGH